MGRRKRGWKVASKLSLGDLQKLVAAKESELVKLTARRADIAAELAGVESEIAAAGDASQPTAEPVKRGPGRPPKSARRGRPPKSGGRPKGKRRGRKAGAKGQSGLHDSIRAVLSGSAGPMKLADIAAKVKAAGYKSKSKHFPVILGLRLSEMADVTRVERGVYAMK